MENTFRYRPAGCIVYSRHMVLILKSFTLILDLKFDLKQRRSNLTINLQMCYFYIVHMLDTDVHLICV